MQGAKKKASQIYYQHNNQIKGENIPPPQKKIKQKKLKKNMKQLSVRERKTNFQI